MRYVRQGKADSKSKQGRFVLGLFLLIGIALEGWMFYALSEIKGFVDNAQISDGVVVKMESRRSSDGDTTYAPIFLYQHPSKGSVRITSTISSNPPSYDVGEKLRVLYDPKNAYDARIDSWFSLWGMPIILGTIGGAFVLVSIFALRATPSGSTNHANAPTRNAPRKDLRQVLKQAGSRKLDAHARTTIVTAELVNSWLFDFMKKLFLNRALSKKSATEHSEKVLASWTHPETKQAHLSLFEVCGRLPFNVKKGAEVDIEIDLDNANHYDVQFDTLRPKR